MAASLVLIKFSLLLASPIVLLGIQTVCSQQLDFSLAASKGGGGFSRFRETINSVQQRQQQLPATTFVRTNVEQKASSVVEVPPPPLVQQSFEQQVTNSQSFKGSSQTVAGNEQQLYGSVEGTPGVDFPAYMTIPNTGFSCTGVPFDGLYADESTGCQVYHICFQGRRESFLCGIGTVFNQAVMACDFWHAVECSKSSQYYSLNSEFGKGAPEPSQLQSISAKSFTQTSQSRAVLPQQPLVQRQQVSSFQSTQSGQTSVPRVSTSQSEFQSQSAFGGGKTSVAKELLNFDTSRLASPSRRLGLMTSGSAPAESNLDMRTQFAASTTSASSAREGGSGKTSLQSEQFSQQQSASGKAAKATSQNDLWKPVFKRKPPSKVSDVGKGAAEAEVRPATPAAEAPPTQAPQVASTSSASPTTTTVGPVETTQPRPPVVDQEPSFSPPITTRPPEPANPPAPETESAEKEAEEVPSVPRSSAPPPSPPPPTTTTSPSPAGESEAPAATTSGEPPASSAASEQPPPETPKETTTTTVAPPQTEAPQRATTTPTADATTTKAPEEQPETTPAPQEGDTGAASEKKSKKKRKKKRANNNSSTNKQHTVLKATNSSVEYVISPK